MSAQLDLAPPADPSEFFVRRLHRIRQDEGAVPRALVDALAQSAGVDIRTAYRWVARGSRERQPRQKAELTQELRVIYYQLNGSVNRVVRHCRKHGIECPPRETLRRRLNDELSAAERAYARNGEAGRRANTVYLEKDHRYRNAVWEADHKELGVLVRPPHVRARPVAPWLTTFMDGKHLTIAGVAITLRPTSADVLAALRTGVLRDMGSIGPVCGVPEEIRWDNGREFLSDAVTEVAVTLGTLPRALPAYTPHLKGHIERWHRTLDDEFLATLPFWQGGPRAANSRLYGPTDGHLTFALFSEQLLSWIEDYNWRRPHSSLGGLTPAQSWSDDPTPIREISADDLRWMALPSKRCKVGPSGIHHAGHKYVAPEVIALRGETVEIRYMPHDERSVDVYVDGGFVCCARVQGQLTAEDEQRFLAERRRQQQEAARLRRQASLRARVRLTSVTGRGDSPEQTTVIDRDQVEAEGGFGGERDNAPTAPAAAPDGLNRRWVPPTSRAEAGGQEGSR